MKTYRPLILQAIRNAAWVMENVDPDDRSAEQHNLVTMVKDMMRQANAGDEEVGRLLVDAVPEWGQPKVKT